MGWRFFIGITLAVAACVGKASDLSPALVEHPLDKAFIPIGFDSNDQIQVAVEGVLPNTCYKVGPHHTEIDQVNKTIRIHQKAYVYLDWCLMVMLPFTRVIDLGLIGDGNYTLLSGKTSKVLGQLPVIPAKSPAADDFLYAPVRDAVIEYDQTQKPSLVLTGKFPNPCMKIGEVRMHYYEDVIVVQPIAEYSGGPETCLKEIIPFTHTVPLKEGISGAFLLHVRAIDGQAINKVVEVRK